MKRAIFVCAVVVASSVQSRAADSLVIMACAWEALHQNSLISNIQDASGNCALGFIGNGDWAQYPARSIPATPMAFSVTYSLDNTNPTRISPIWDDLNGIYLGDYTLPGTGSWTTIRTQRFEFPAEISTVDLSGMRKLVFQFAGGGPNGEGAGNMVKYTFYFDASSVHAPVKALPAQRVGNSLGLRVRVGSGTSSVITRGRTFDIRGRSIQVLANASRGVVIQQAVGAR